MIIQLQKSANRKLVSVSMVQSELGVTESTAIMLASQASAMIENFCGRTFAIDRVKEKLPGNGTTILRLSRFPVVEIFDDNAGGEYDTDRENGWLHSSGWTWKDSFGSFNTGISRFPVAMANPPGNYEIEYSAGYCLPDDENCHEDAETLPGDIQAAAMMLCKTLYMAKDRDTSLSSESIGDWSWSAGEGGVMHQVIQLLDKYVVNV